jgi:predicted 2-oxoglutarate/Fe(II)-dependent dioxygenase YbiX
MSDYSHVWYWKSEVPPQICDYIIKFSEKNKYETGTAGNNSSIDYKTRNVDVQFSELRWVNSMLLGYINQANAINFYYDLSKYDHEKMQISRYESGKYYGLHTDFSPSKTTSAHLRKLSLSLQLSGIEDYSGGDLIITIPGQEENFVCPKSKGSIVIFDSRLEHEVTPVEEGVRYSLVKWVQGDNPLR